MTKKVNSKDAQRNKFLKDMHKVIRKANKKIKQIHLLAEDAMEVFFDVENKQSHMLLTHRVGEHLFNIQAMFDSIKQISTSSADGIEEPKAVVYFRVRIWQTSNSQFQQEVVVEKENIVEAIEAMKSKADNWVKNNTIQ